MNDKTRVGASGWTGDARRPSCSYRCARQRLKKLRVLICVVVVLYVRCPLKLQSCLPRIYLIVAV